MLQFILFLFWLHSSQTKKLLFSISFHCVCVCVRKRESCLNSIMLCLQLCYRPLPLLCQWKQVPCLLGVRGPCAYSCIFSFLCTSLTLALLLRSVSTNRIIVCGLVFSILCLTINFSTHIHVWTQTLHKWSDHVKFYFWFTFLKTFYLHYFICKSGDCILNHLLMQNL